MSQLQPHPSPVTRRKFLRTAGTSALLLPALGGGLTVLLDACGSSGSTQTTGSGGSASGGPSSAAPAGSSSVAASSAAPSSAASVGSSAATSSASAKPISETLQTPFGLIVSFVEFYIAQDLGFWEQENLKVDIKGGTGTASATQSVLGGSTAYSRASGIDTIIATVNEGAGIRTVGMAFQRSEFFIASLPGKGINKPEDLKGKTVGIVSPNGATQELLEVMLDQAGVSRESVTMPVTGVGSAAYQLAKQGKVDAWIALDVDLATLKKGGADISSFSTDKYAPIPADNYIAANTLIKENPDAITRFLAGIVKAMDFGAKPENIDRVVKAAQSVNPQLKASDIQTQVPIMAADWSAGGTKTPVKLYPDAWDKAQQTLLKSKMIKKTIDVGQLIDTTFIDKVLG